MKYNYLDAAQSVVSRSSDLKKNCQKLKTLCWEKLNVVFVARTTSSTTAISTSYDGHAAETEPYCTSHETTGTGSHRHS